MKPLLHCNSKQRSKEAEGETDDPEDVDVNSEWTGSKRARYLVQRQSGGGGIDHSIPEHGERGELKGYLGEKLVRSVPRVELEPLI